MPVQEHPDQAFSFTEPDTDVAWMNLILSPSVADLPAVRSPALTIGDDLAHAIDSDLPPSSFRLQFLRAWIAARDSHPSKAPGHA